MFDDVFSGLDKVTEQAVFSRVFGKDGLLRKNGTTVILATHAGEFFRNRIDDYSTDCIQSIDCQSRNMSSLSTRGAG